MQDRVRETLLKVLSFTALAAFYYPVVAVIKTMLFGSSAGTLGFVPFIGEIFVGYLVGVFIIREDDYKFIRTPIANLCVFVPAAAVVYIYRGDGWIRVGVEALFAVILYFAGLKGCSLRYGDVLTTGRVNGGVILIAACLIGSGYIDKLTILRPMFFYMAYAGLFITLICRNQEGLEHYIRNDRGSSGMPQFIRSKNTIYVSTIFLVILLTFNLRNIVLYLMALSGKIVRYILYVIYRIILFITPSGASTDSQAVPSQNPQMPAVVGSTNPWLEMLNNILFYALLILCLYIALKFLTAAIKKLVVFIMDKIRMFMDQKTTVYSRACEDYFDEVENIDEGPQRRSWGRTSKKGRKPLKGLTDIKDGAQKIRYIYSNILQLLMNRNIDIRNTDTTCDIFKKSLEFNSISHQLSEVTKVYEGVRYGDRVPDQTEASNVFDKYEEIAKHLKGK